jgi:fibronectin-binding autotransporter adhesin
MKKNLKNPLLATLIAFNLSAHHASAVDFWWDGGTANWATNTAWTANASATTPDPVAAPGSATDDDLTFNRTGTNTNNIVTLAANRAAKSLTFGSTGTSLFRANASGTTTARSLTIGSGGVTLLAGSGAVTIADTVATFGAINIALSANQTWTNNATTNTFTIPGIVSGEFNLTKTGAGQIRLNGANTFTGSLTVSSGILTIGSYLGLSTVSSLSVSGGGTSNLSLAQVGTGTTTNSINKSLSLHGTLSTSGGTSTNRLNQTMAGAITLAGNSTITNNGNSSFIITGPVDLGANVLNYQADGTGSRISGSITGAGGSLNKTSAQDLALTGTNTYTGTTTVSLGRLLITNRASLYNSDTAQWTAAKINALTGGTLAFNLGGATEFSSSDVTLLLTNLADSSSLTNGMNAGSNIGFDTTNAGGSFTIADAITNTTGANGGALGLTKLGTGTLTLTSAVHSYTGATSVLGGTLRMGSTTTSAIFMAGNRLEIAADTSYNIPTFGMQGGTVVSDRATTGAGITHVLGNASIGNGTNSFIAGTNVTSGTSVFQFGNVTNDNGTPATPTLNPTTANLNITGTVSLGVVNTGIATLTLGGTGSVNYIAGAIGNGTRATGNVIKSGSSAWTVSGNNTYNGTTEVNGGLLVLDYSSQDNNKLSDTAALTLGNGTLEISGGSHTETVLSTTLTANTSSRVNRSSGSGVLQMNAITRNAGAAIDFSAGGIASTDTLNTDGILGAWATIAGTDFASNSTNLEDGLITVATYTDVTRLNGGLQVIADNFSTNVRIIEGSGSAANLTLAAPITTINTLNHSIEGGTSAATIVIAGQTLQTNAILAGPTAGVLTIGNGTLSTATQGGVLRLISNSTNGITINASITDNATASALVKQGTGLVTLGAINNYTGATTVNQGTLTVGPDGSLGSTTAALAVNNDNRSGAGTSTILNLASVGDTTVGTLSGTITPLVSGTNTVTINTGGSGLNFTVNPNAAATFPGVIAGAGNFAYNGSTSNTLTLSGSHTYTGSTSIGSGVLLVGNLNPFGTNPGVNGTSGISMSAGTILRAAVVGATINAPITTAGTVTFGTMNNSSGQVFSEFILNGVISGESNVNLDSFHNTNTIQTITLGTANSYTGSTTIGATNPGTASQIVVKLGVNNALPTTTILDIRGGTGSGTGRVAELNLFGFNQTLAGLTNTASSLRTQRIVNSDVSAAATLTIDGEADTTFSGSLGSNSANFSVGATPMPGSTNGNNFGLTKAGSGTFTLSGINTYTGNTAVNAGILQLADNGRLNFVLGTTSGSNNRISGAATVNLDGDFTINTAAADALETGSWTIVSNATLTETFSSTFSLVGFTDAGGDKWTKANGATKVYTFDESTGILTLGAAASYSSWIADFFPSETNPAIIGATADPDNDGIKNSVEMVVGGNPNLGSDSALQPTIELVNADPDGDTTFSDYMLFTYRRSDLSVAAGLTATCATDTDLVDSWTTAVNGVSGVVILTDNNYTFTPPAAANTDRVRVYVPRAANTKLFGRLTIITP